MTEFQPLIDAHFKRAKAEGRVEPIEACAFDALIELAGTAAAPKTDATTEAEADTREVPRD